MYLFQAKFSRFIPKNDNIKKQTSFFNRVAYIMKNKYKNYFYKEMDQFTKFMCNPNVKSN